MQKNMIIFVVSCVIGVFAFYNLTQIRDEANGLVQKRIGVRMELNTNELTPPRDRQEHQEKQQQLQEKYDDLNYQIDAVTSRRPKFIVLFFLAIIGAIAAIGLIIYQKVKRK
ncbi:hypothetical protein [Candidatus Uabimicrobium amorphum]|uniref:Uncharacterized protein n=1 Tax=Uabimicrobium amorphum TaxID=2596890 RepID=A0A5S9F5C3_UABAM|nr:hypothetical protein [Candidatus Uabimicrobium amorphum]BBM85414.1 hypothetical protein UABAM_03781 [Candidatus Uabimicrobium amorphum]